MIIAPFLIIKSLNCKFILEQRLGVRKTFYINWNLGFVA